MTRKAKCTATKSKKVSVGRRIWRITYRTILALWLISILWVVMLKYVPVYFTPLMIRRSVEAVVNGEKPHNEKRWIPLTEIHYNLPLACVASEDNLFLTHNGFSKTAIVGAIEDHRKGKPLRGASTISQQTAKNVFTFGTHTWFRKGIEVYYTILIENIWGKERIMEVYLNIVELGNGIYGAEAASQHYFNKTAAKVSRPQAAIIAAALPNPRKYSITRPGPYMLRRQAQILALMPKMRQLPFDCIGSKVAKKTKDTFGSSTKK